MAAWIIQGKITRPAQAPAPLPRSFWPTEGLPPATLLLAGPGYGKTQAMLALAAEADRAGHTTAWTTFDELDGDVGTVFAHLIAAVRLQVPPFGAETEALLGAHVEPRVLWQAFFRELAGYNARPGAILFLDDVHHLQAGLPEVARALTYSLDKLPAGVHVVAASRLRPAGSLERLVGRGLLRQLGPAELGFTVAEATQLWAASRDEPPPPDWADVVRLYEGWPLGVAYAAARPAATAAARGTGALGAYAAGRPGGAAAPRGTGPLGLAFATARPGGAGGPRVTNARLLRYIAEEVLGAQPAATQALMVRTAPLLAITAPACEAALDLPDAEGALAGLADAQLLERTADGAYRYPTYLRDFLVDEARRRLPADERAVLHERAGAHYLALRRPDLAFPHLVEGGAWAAAIAVLRAQAPALLARGAAGQLRRWLAALPEALQPASWVQFWWGQLAWRAGEGARATTHWLAALSAFQGEGDGPGETKARLRLHTQAVTQGGEGPHADPAAVARAVAAHGGDEDRADMALAEAMAADQRGDLAAWQAANERVLGLPVGTNVEVAQCACIAHMNLFTLALHRGELAQARLHADETLAVARAWAFHPEALYAGVLRAHLLALTGDLDGAGQTLRALPAAWEEVLDWHDQASTHYVLGAFHLAAGDWPAAEDHLARASARFDQAGFPMGRKLPLERQAWLAILRERPRDALARVDAAGPLDRANVYDLALRLARARALTLAGEAEAALADLAAIAQDADAMRAPLPAARARLYAAAARLRAGDGPGGRAALAAVQADLERGGYAFLRRQDARLWQDLEALPAAPAAPAPEPAAAPPAAGPSPGPVAPSVKLELRLFGGLEARLADVLVDQWPRRKAKVVLAALALEPRGVSAITLAELIEDRTARQAGVQMCVAALRRQFEPALADGPRSRYVLLQDDRYQLAAGMLGACDVRAFATAVQAGLRARDDDPEAARTQLEDALALYRGNLLDEPFFEPWFEAEREGFRRQAVEALGWLHERYAFRGEERQALACLERAAAIAPCDDEVVGWALAYHGRRRAPERVRTAYWDHRKALHRRLGLAPSPEVEAAYQAALAQAGGA